MIRRSDFDVPLPGRRRIYKKTLAKLTPAAVREIRARAGQETQQELAAAFSVTQPAISYILRGLRWADVE